MTDIVDIPAALPISRFPHVDEEEAPYNQAAYEFGTSLPPAVERAREIIEAGRTNSLAAKEQAVAAAESVTAAAAQANRARDESDAAMAYRNQAGQHAGTASTKAGEAALSAKTAADQVPLAAAEVVKAIDQVSLAAAEVVKASEQVSLAEEQKGLATQEADRANAAAESISSGPITSLRVHSGLKTGAVTLALVDLGPQATESQMQQGTASDPILMSPADVKSTIAIARVERSANVQLTGTDIGKWFALSGTFTQTFLAPAALGAGWWCYMQNSGTGDITIPSSDGRTNWIMYPGEMRLFQCDGSTLRSVVLSAFCKVFTLSGSFIKPPGYLAFEGLLWGGGCSGGAGVSFVSPGGPCEEIFIPSALLSESTAVVIGAGGARINYTGGYAGNPGGVSSFGNIATTAVAWNTWPRWEGGLGQTADGRPEVYGVSKPGRLAGGSGGLVDGLGAQTQIGGRGGDGRTAAGIEAQDGVAPGGAGGNSNTSGTQTGAGARGEFRILGVC